MGDLPICAICGERSHHAHHLTGREGEPQLDPDLVAPVCHDDHDLIHEDLRFEGLDRPLVDATTAERLERRLRRLSFFLLRVGETYPDFTWVPVVALHCQIWADDLASSDSDDDWSAW
jgi:hypothetical protein